MESKPWYTSKTLWANFIAFVALTLQHVTGHEVISIEMQAYAIVGINAFLRFVTKGKVTIA